MNYEKDYLLTIAIPTYNRAKYLKRALKSIAEQYDDRLEIIVSDNASLDDTEEVVQEIEKHIPIKYLKNKENIGSDMNFLQCLREASGKYTVLLGDDDLIIDGKMEIILNFLESFDDLSLIFINHTYYSGEYDQNNPGRLYNNEIDNRSYMTKKQFFDYVRREIIYMSSIVLSTKRVRSINDAEKYSWTFFMHSCVAFESTKNDDNNLGVIGTPCIAKDDTHDEHTNVNKPEIYFPAYVRGAKYLFYELAPSCGYDKEQMCRLFYPDTLKFERYIIRLNAENYPNWKDCFWKYAYPSIKEFPLAWIRVMPAVIMPRFLAKFLWYTVRSVYKKIKAIFKKGK